MDRREGSTTGPRHGWILAATFLILLGLLAGNHPAAAASIGPDTYVTGWAVFGFELTPSYGEHSLSGSVITDVGPNPITLGTFGPDGKVVGGDAVLVGYLDFGTVPVPSVYVAGPFSQAYVTPDAPRASWIVTSGGIWRRSHRGLAPYFRRDPRPWGLRGR